MYYSVPHKKHLLDKIKNPNIFPKKSYRKSHEYDAFDAFGAFDAFDAVDAFESLYSFIL